MIDLGKKTDLERLHKAIKTSRNAIDPFRKVRTEFCKDHAGSWYSSNGARNLTYVNLLNQTARIYTAALAFNNPQVKINSFDPRNWPFCQKYQVNVNKVVSNIDFKTTFQAGLLDAFFLMGIFKTRMADSGELELDDNVWIDPGKVWVDRISFDDVILDMSAKDIRAMRFCGDRYRCSYDKVMERDDFDKKVRDKLTPTSKYNGDSGGGYASEISTANAVDDDELEPMIWLEDVYIPSTRQLITFCADNDTLPPLKVMDDEDQGPMGAYDFLNLGLVPDNIIPSSPAQNLKGLHDLANRLYRKLSAQAARQKNTVAYAAGAEDDAKRAKDAKDGEYFKMRDPKAVNPISFPGVDGNTHAFFMACEEVYNVQAGNPKALGGLGRTSDTLGQEEIVQGQAMGMIGFMKGACTDCAANICRKIGALMFEDEALTVDSSMEAENTGYYVDSSWRPGERQGIKDHYEFSVEPNSMAYAPPEAKLQKVMGYLQTIGTVYPLVQAGLLDLQELTKLVAEYQNIPELQKVFKQIQQQQGMPGQSNEATKAPVTSREVVRKDRGGGPSGDGMSAVLSQMMQGNQSNGVQVGA